MNGVEKVVKHLEMTQTVVNRLASNSFLVKSWSLTIIVAALVLIAKLSMQNSPFILVFIFPSIGFWILDGYFLWQERLFREVYNEIRLQSDTDFEMNPMKHKINRNVGGEMLSFLALLLFFTWWKLFSSSVYFS